MMLSAAFELGVGVFLLSRVLQYGGSGREASDGVHLHRGFDGNPWTEDKHQDYNTSLKNKQQSKIHRIQMLVSSPTFKGLVCCLVFKILQQDDDNTPFPSATRGLLFFNHVMFAAGLASCATHAPSCGGKHQNVRKKKKLHLERIIEKKKDHAMNFRANLHLLTRQVIRAI